MSSDKVSSQPRKVRKREIYTAQLHVRSKRIVAPLSKELSQKLGLKRIRVRKGDRVLIVRGSFKGHEGKITSVDVKRGRIHVEGAMLRKADGTEVPYPIHPSKVVVLELDLSDPRRKELVERKKQVVVSGQTS
ncbi:MAG: 50S ribosomal protein L24 [Thermofilum sp.]|jgi:large subunit ribosomal protein L24|uniref:50S ribosomal protein L24 n=1 Tax=Thermofilum sp. TaxID=1961369 RepID=UPI002583C197|nr:50S ribosomal protein L24 [Thermofilum sp.]MCI4409897.1 50S ribosomal protein L24 [Thermofilum sp.]